MELHVRSNYEKDYDFKTKSETTLQLRMQADDDNDRLCPINIIELNM